MENLLFLGVPILKHIRVLSNFLYFTINTYVLTPQQSSSDLRGIDRNYLTVKSKHSFILTSDDPYWKEHLVTFKSIIVNLQMMRK